MKTNKLITLLVALIPLGSLAQGVQKSGKISSKYDRNSLATFYIHVPDEKYSNRLKTHLGAIEFNDKFDNNNAADLVLQPGFNRQDLTFGANKIIGNYLNQIDVAKFIVNTWFNRQPDGRMDMELVFNRGMFNATDAAYIKAQASKRGNALLKDYGERLIAKSFVLVLDFIDIKNQKDGEKTETHGWNGQVNGYLYRINFDENTRSQVYQCWIYDDDTPETIEQKKQQYDSLKITLNYVTSVNATISATQPDPSTTLGQFVIQKTDDELLDKLVQKGYDECIYRLERKVDEFMVKTTITSVKPITAKIGRKEGLKCDHRYFVYEYVYDENTKTTKTKRRGVIRATNKIVDNRHVAHGDMGTSKFYQVHGKPLEEGYLLTQHNDLGAEVWATYQMGQVGGFDLRIDYRVSRFVKMRALFLYGELGIQSKSFTDSKLKSTTGITYPTLDNIAFTRYSLGVAKGFQIIRNFELRPYLGIGAESASGKAIEDCLGNDEKNKSISTTFMNFGMNLALNLLHNFQLTTGLSFYSFAGNATDQNNNEYQTWEEIFPNRKGVSGSIGLKIMF